MKLLTADIRKKMPGPRAQENNPDPVVYAKFFHPWTQWTWFAYEAWAYVGNVDDGYREVSLGEAPDADPEDVVFFGLVYGDYTEYGTFALQDLMENSVERDRHFTPKPLSQVKEEMRKRGYSDF